jgi:nucleoside-diphosphate-sugar epimerase
MLDLFEPLSNPSMRKRMLVTGGAGFLGSHLCERLIEQGHDVLCADNLFTGSKRPEHVYSRHRPSDDPKQRQPDITVASAMLGWEPQVRLSEGLDQTIAYFSQLLKH